MYPDGSMSRNYEFAAGPLDEDYMIRADERISINRTHIAVVELNSNGLPLVKVRIGVRADGALILGPVELWRAEGYGGDWLPPLCSFEDFTEILLTPS
jgi:hypothetical protein